MFTFYIKGFINLKKNSANFEYKASFFDKILEMKKNFLFGKNRYSI